MNTEDITWDDDDDDEIEWDDKSPGFNMVQGPPTPFMSAATNTPEEMATNRRLAEQQGVPVTERSFATPDPSTTDLAKRLKAGEVVPFEDVARAKETSAEQFAKGVGVGALQAGTLGWADELAAAASTGGFSGEGYKNRRDQFRSYLEQAEINAPIGSFVGRTAVSMAGGAALPAMGPLAATAAGAAAGAAQGAGESRYEDWRGIAQDSLIGGGIGGAGALVGSLAVGGKAADAARRVDRRTVDALGFKGTRTMKNNIALQGKRLARETDEMAGLASEIDDALADALEEVNKIAPAKGLTMRELTGQAAQAATDSDERAVKALADYARKTGVDPYARGFDGSQTAGAARAARERVGARIGEIQDAVNTRTGGIDIDREIKAELSPIAGRYSMTPGDTARDRVGAIGRIIDDYERIYPPEQVTAIGGTGAPVPKPGSRKVPVQDFARTKTAVSTPAYGGSAAMNPSVGKEGQQELADSLNKILKKHIAKAEENAPELAGISAEMAELNKQYGFAKAVEKAAEYRAAGDISGQRTFLENLRDGKLLGGAAGKVQDFASDIAQRRDRVIAYLMRMGESESEAKRLASKLVERGIRGTPQAVRAAAQSVTPERRGYASQVLEEAGEESPPAYDNPSADVPPYFGP